MKGAVLAGKDQFLKDPKQGFVASNILTVKFTRASFTFKDPSEVEKGFIGQTLLVRRNKTHNFPAIISLLKELGMEVFDTLAEATIEGYNLHDEIAKLGDDPVLLYRYLLLTRPDLTEEAIRQIAQSAFSGMKENNRVQVEELHATYPFVDGGFDGFNYPASTQEGYVEISGKIEGDFESVQIMGDGTKKIALKPDGSFSGKVRLKIGEENLLQIYGIHEEKRQKGPITTIRIRQEGVKEDPQMVLANLISKVQGLEEQLLADPNRLAYLTKTYERELVRRFMIDGIAAGFAALSEKIKTCDSVLFKKIYTEIERKFTLVDRLTIPHLKPDQHLYFYQKYCLFEIKSAMEDSSRVPAIILANEQGLGKTIVVLAALELMKRQGMIVAPNAVVSTWGEQQSHFFSRGTMKIVHGEAQSRAEVLQGGSGQSRVTNMEYLRSEAQDRFDLMNLPGEKQVLVFDEAQFLSSSSSQQSQGARKLKGGFKILVSATPFSSIRTVRPILEFMEGNKYGNGQAFGMKFRLEDPDSIRLLHLMMDRYLLRFRKKDVFQEYDRSLPLESQKDRLPAKTFIPPETSGDYELTEKQCEAVLQIFLDWESWQERLRGRSLTYEDRLIVARTKNFFSRRESLRQLMNDPSYGGVSSEKSPKHQKMDEIVDREVREREGKILIYCRYRADVQQYARRYAQFGAMTYYGGTSEVDGKKQDWLKDYRGHVRMFKMKNENEFAIGADGKLIEDANGSPIDPLDYSRLMFQNDPETRVLIATYDSGAVGVTLTAADAVAFSDMARDYVIQYQAEDRANRIDNNRRKYDVRYYTMVAKYPERFLEKAKDYVVVRSKETQSASLVKKSKVTPEMQSNEDFVIEDLYQTYLAQGTYDAVHRQNMETQRRIFELIIDGIQSEKEQAVMASSALSAKMPFLLRGGVSGDETLDKEAQIEEDIEEEKKE